jgi:glycosyltransferase involved in cell wall biosynthesis
MTRLIFINRYFFPDHSATSQMLTDLAFSLTESAGFDIHVVTSRQRYDDALADLPKDESCNGVKIHRVWTSRFGRQNLLGRAFDYLTFYMSALGCLVVLAQKGSVIIAKTDPPLISLVAALVAKLKSAILINWIQDLFPEVAAALEVRLAKGPIYGALRWLRNVSLSTARMNVVIGELMREKLIKEAIAADCLQVIHNWADEDQIRPINPENNSLREEWGLAGKFVVGYSGNLGRGHEFGTILEAAFELKDKKEIVFLFIGNGANLSWVKREAQRRGLNNIVFKPYQPRECLAESLSAADIHLISLRPALEGLIVPSKFYGIAAVARPILFIGSSEGEIAGTLSQSNIGYSINEGDSSVLADRILELFQNRAACHLKGKVARTIYEQSFSKSTAMTRWRRLLDETNNTQHIFCE